MISSRTTDMAMVSMIKHGKLAHVVSTDNEECQRKIKREELKANTLQRAKKKQSSSEEEKPKAKPLTTRVSKAQRTGKKPGTVSMKCTKND